MYFISVGTSILFVFFCVSFQSALMEIHHIWLPYQFEYRQFNNATWCPKPWRPGDPSYDWSPAFALTYETRQHEYSHLHWSYVRRFWFIFGKNNFKEPRYWFSFIYDFNIILNQLCAIFTSWALKLKILSFVQRLGGVEIF